MSVELASFPGGGLRVPRIGLGGGGFSMDTRRESAGIIHAAEEFGFCFIDTADVYNDGASEVVIGEAIKGRRDRFIIATKCGHHPLYRGASRRAIRNAVHKSLWRLGTDYLDLIHLHTPDAVTPCEETILTFQDLVREGKILYYGLSNHNAWQIIDAVHVARALKGQAPLSVQIQINVTALAAHSELLAAAERANIGILAASPLARGLLGRNYSLENPPPDGHPLRGSKGRFIWTEEKLAAAARLREVAKARSCSPAQLALGFVLSLPKVVSLLVRPTSRSDFNDYLAAADQKPTAAEATYIRYGGKEANEWPSSAPLL